jgi:SAM-dependent methyltransferase
MGTRRVLLTTINRALRPFNFELSELRAPHRTIWDGHFTRWIREARASGRDPNDIGDERWSEDLLDIALEQHYLPNVNADSIVLELGPGSGRLSRHLIGACRELIVVDASPVTCDWIREYLSGKGRYRVYRSDGPRLPMVDDHEVSAVFAHGVVEHLDLDELFWFLVEFHRVLRPGGGVAFNFDNVMTERGAEVMSQDGPGNRALFRVQHPESIRRVAEVAGFSDVEIFCTSGRIAFARLTKARADGAKHVRSSG